MCLYNQQTTHSKQDKKEILWQVCTGVDQGASGDDFRVKKTDDY
jgi:hypothetical protein